MRLLILALISAVSIAIPMGNTPPVEPRTLDDVFNDLKRQITTVAESMRNLNSPFAIKSCSAVEAIADANDELKKISAEVSLNAADTLRKKLTDDIVGLHWCIFFILVDPHRAERASVVMTNFKQLLNSKTYPSSRHASVSKEGLGQMPEYGTIIQQFGNDVNIILRAAKAVGGPKINVIYHARRRMCTQLIALKSVLRLPASANDPIAQHLTENQKANVVYNFSRIQLYAWYLLTGYPDRPDDVKRMQKAVETIASARQEESNLENSRVPNEKLLDSPPTLDDLFARCRREAEIVLKAEPDMTASPDAPATRTVNNSRLRLDSLQYFVRDSFVRPELERERPKIKTDVEGVLLGIKRNISCILFSHPRRDDPDRRQAVANLKIFVGFYTAARDEGNRKFHENIDEIAASFRKEKSCSHFSNAKGDRA